MLYGYARESAASPPIKEQVSQLKAAGCTTVFVEETWDGRDELAKAMHAARFGDVIVVTSLDRLSWTIRHIFTHIRAMRKSGVGFQSLTEPWADPTSEVGRHVLTILEGLAHFERVARTDQVNTSRILALKAGVQFGRRPKLNQQQQAEILALWASEHGPSMQKIADDYKVNVSTISRIISPRLKLPQNKP